MDTYRKCTKEFRKVWDEKKKIFTYFGILFRQDLHKMKVFNDLQARCNFISKSSRIVLKSYSVVNS